MANGVSLKKLRAEIKREEKIVTYKDLVDAFSKSRLRTLNLEFGDTDYKLVPIKTWRKLIRHMGAHKIEYIPEFRDCEDIAKYFSALASIDCAVNSAKIVKDWSGKHAYNAIFVWTTGGIRLIALEPQTGKVVKKFSGQYRAEQGRIV